MIARALLLTALVTFSAPFVHAADQLPGRVLRVIDGDSLVLDVRGGQYRVDLHGIDAPERNQPWGDTAAQALHRLTTGAFVVVDQVGFDAPGIARGSLSIAGRDVGETLLWDGLAWSTMPADPDPDAPPHAYNSAERQARDARRGLWSDPQQVPPWTWRGEPAPHDDQSRSMR